MKGRSSLLRLDVATAWKLLEANVYHGLHANTAARKQETPDYGFHKRG